MLNYLDILLFLITAWFVYIGFKKRLIMDLISLLGVFLAIFLAMESLEIVAPVFASINLFSARASVLTSFLFVFLIIIYIWRFVDKWIQGKIGIKLPDNLDRFSGLAVGLIKGTLLGTVLITILALLNFQGTVGEHFANSNLRKPVALIGIGIYNFAAKPIPGSLTYVGTLEAAAREVGISRFDAAYYDHLADLGSEEAEKWKTTASK